MDIIKCVVRGQRLSVNIPFMVDLTINYFNVSASFDSAWKDYPQRWVHITKHGDSSVGGSFLLDEDNKVPNTYSLNLNGGLWDIWFHGVKVEDSNVESRITTEVKSFRVTATGNYEAVMPDIPESNVEIITAIAQEAKDIAENVEARADAGDFDGEPGEKGDKGDKGDPGPYFTPHVSEDGDLSWTNNGSLPNPASVNLTDEFLENVAVVQAAVAQAQAGVNGIQAQRDTILQSIASAAELGTDTTLTTPGMAADAYTTGQWVVFLQYILSEGGNGWYAQAITYTDGGYIDRNNGNVVAYTNWKYSDYVEVAPNTRLLGTKPAGGTGGSNYNAYYDSDKNFIAGFGFSGGITTLQPPANAKYMRLSVVSQTIATCILIPSNVSKRLSNVERAVNSNILVNGAFVQGNRTTAGAIDNTNLERVTWNNSVLVNGTNKYKLASPSNYATSVWMYKDNNGSLQYIGWTGYKQGEYIFSMLPDTDRVLVVAMRVGGGALLPSDPNLSKITISEMPIVLKNTNIKVCSYNVGLWYDGVQSGVPASEVAERTTSWRRVIGSENCDLMLMEEARKYFDANNTVNAYASIFQNNYKWNWRTDSGEVVAQLMLIASKYNIHDVTVVNTGVFSERPYITFWAEIDSKKINFILCHLSLEDNSTGPRQDQMDVLSTLLGTYEYGVLCGDFNTHNISEFDEHFSSFNMANHGYFGDFETWPHDSGNWNKCIDNIITTTNITIENVKVINNDLSDHLPLIAELNIY